MKKKIIISTLILTIFLLFLTVIIIENNEKKRKEKATIEVVLKDDLSASFLEQKKVSDYITSINGKIVNDYEIDTTKLGTQDINFEFINNDGIKLNYDFQIEVKDTKPPLAFVNSTYYIKKGGSKNFYKSIFCGDDYDPNPKCYIEGEYDTKKVGTYPVKFIAEDSSGNRYTKDINIVVYNPSHSSGGGSSVNKKKTYFNDVYEKYKSNNTKIGIDVSKWQGEIDFDQLKEDGVEFIIIRVGWGYLGEYTIDENFKRNISEANRVGIPVGVYFYSYASSRNESIQDALWVVEQLKGYQVDLPIAFDWEDWGDFNDYNVSFYSLSEVARVFLDVVGLYGYDGMLYGSKNYLEKIWLDIGYDIWLAHYTNKTDYQGDYTFWQLCQDGRVSGIKGDVDINIWYLD